MTYSKELKNHTDYGYNNFFKEISDEFNELYYNNLNPGITRCDAIIDKHLKPFNAHLERKGNDAFLVFDSEEYFTWFVLKWC